MFITRTRMFGCGLLLLVVVVFVVVDGTTTTTLRYRDLRRRLQSSAILHDDNNNNDDDGRRAIRYNRWSPTSFTYAVGQTAAFGNPLRNLHNDDTDVNTDNTNFPNGPQPAQQRTYNLLLPPPPHRWLCELPSFNVDDDIENNNNNNNNNETSFTMVLPSHPAPLALFVSLGQCSAEQSARVAVELQNRLFPRLELLVVYSGEPRPPRNTSHYRSCHGPHLPPPLQPDDVEDRNNTTTTTTTSLQDEKELENNVGILYINEEDAVTLMSQIRLVATGYSSRKTKLDWQLGGPPFLGGRRSSADWFLPLHVAPFNETFDHEYYRYDRYCRNGEFIGSGHHHHHGMKWLGAILIALVVAAELALLWFGCGGGPWRWRRTADGRIRGCYPTRVPRCCRARCCGQDPLDDGVPIIVHTTDRQSPPEGTQEEEEELVPTTSSGCTTAQLE